MDWQAIKTRWEEMAERLQPPVPESRIPATADGDTPPVPEPRPGTLTGATAVPPDAALR
jgi:hypothetical protein